MAVFIKEDSEKKLKKAIHLPKELTNLMVNKNNYYGKIDPKLQGYKRAKKIANANEKIAYNTTDDKFSNNESGVTLNYNEIKRWNHALKTLPKNSDAFDANGGEKAKEMVGDLARRVKQDSQKVQMVQPIEKLVKDVKVSDKQTKPSKINGVDVYLESKKTIYLNESQLRLLTEDYRQLTLPFSNKFHKVNGVNIPTKMDYEYFVDWLEHIGKYGKLPTNNNPQNISNIVQSVFKNNNAFKDKLLDDLIDNGYLGDCLTSLFEVIIVYYPQYLACSEEEFRKKFDPWGDIDEFKSFLNDEGAKWLDAELYEFIENRLSDFGFLDNLIEKNGLIYVERVITLPSLTNYKGSTDSKIDFFQKLNNNYGGVGICWTWSPDEGNAYNGGNGEDITFKGWVKIEDIDWESTVYLNCYYLNDEKEIRMSENAFVQIDEIEINGRDEHLPIKLPIIVPAN